MKVHIEDNHLIISDQSMSQNYEISLKRMDTPEKILSWVRHLGEKNWVTAPLLKEIVMKATRHHKIELPWT
jgi:hypothetical protein